jgi:oligopeptide/dipeptide ABC transporter ATP-binding protein
MIQSEANILEVRNVKKYYPVHKGIGRKVSSWVRAVDGVSFALGKGRTLGLVGESGCGKSTTGRVILRLVEPDEGEILFNGVSVLDLGQRDMQAVRKDMQLVFQDPYASLNPRLTVSEIIEEGLVVHGMRNRKERQEKIAWVLDRVGIRPDMMDRYPHEFSGGQRQRIGIARAVVLNPKLIVADEPVSALDVSIQAQVMNLMVEIQEQWGISFLVIAHDLSVVEYLSDQVAVMYLGKILELASDRNIYLSPKHPYTEFLLASIPSLDPGIKKQRALLEGEVPSPISPPEGCRFGPRCPKRFGPCGEIPPELKEVSQGHWVACHLY